MKTAPIPLASKIRQLIKESKYAPVETAIRRLLPPGRRAAWLHGYLAWRAARHPRLESALRAIAADHPDARAIFAFPHGLDWHRQLFQRPQQLARALAAQGALVFYTQLTPPEGGQPITALQERLYLCSVPLEIFSVLGDVVVYSLTWNRKYLLKFARPRILYDYLDDVAAFEGDTAQLARDHHALLREAEMVITTARQLLENIHEQRPDAVVIPNGVDFAHFALPPDAVPPEMAALRGQNRPLLGYYGALASWFDYDLLRDVAQARPAWQFVLIGTDHDASLAASGLLRLENVRYLGPKPYAALPAYLACFDAALLPFKINAITQATSPIKLFEYCAGGKPVVSTPLREVQQYAAVRIGRTAPEFLRQIEAALAARDDPDEIEQRQQVARENTWETHAARILRLVAQGRQP